MRALPDIEGYNDAGYNLAIIPAAIDGHYHGNLN